MNDESSDTIPAVPATLIQLNVSDGGMPKLAVPSAMVSTNGVEGDRQQNLKYHGGPDRAVLLFSTEFYDWLRERGIDLQFGCVGENFTTRGLDLCRLELGTRLRVGDCLIQITSVRKPCKNLNQWHPELLKTILGRSGLLAKVLKPAVVSCGDTIILIDEIKMETAESCYNSSASSIRGAS